MPTARAARTACASPCSTRRPTAPRPRPARPCCGRPTTSSCPWPWAAATDAEGDALTLAVTAIRQDEPVGKGNSAPDGKGVGAAAAELRAEKLGSGNGRVYHVSFTASDGHGGACTGVVRVAVPHDQAKPAVDGGPLYDSTLAALSEPIGFPR